MRRLLGPLAAALLLVACGGREQAGPPARAAQAATGATGADLCAAGEHPLPAAGGGLLHVPAGGPARRPLLLAFHGAGGEARGTRAYYELERVTDRDGAIVAYPQAVKDRFWQLRPDQGADVDQVRALLDALTALPCVDPARVTATGVSNGGGFTARIACDLGDRLAGAAPVAGGYGSLRTCRSRQPVSLLEVHGLADPVVPYAGKPPERAGAVLPFVTGWVRRDGCAAKARRTMPRRGVERLSWSDCTGGARVAHLRLARTDHGWPGGNSRAAGFGRSLPRHDPTGLDTSAVVWAFLRAARRP